MAQRRMRSISALLETAGSEASLIRPSKNSHPFACCQSNYKRAAIYVMYIGAVIVILWQTRTLYPETPTVGGYILVCVKIFFILLVVVSSIKLFFCLKDFYSSLHNEDYIPSPSKPARKYHGDGGHGDVSVKEEDEAADIEDDDYEEFCRREGFALPKREKAEDNVEPQLG
ncbi:uncharacterized protein LOC135367985 [Ornithodoros turicata]|uniref:uncharacterized protein LOC135367985 n=1 Tax=Ornithodoros turicata TaxID=34597 RepID=UPI003138E44B